MTALASPPAVEGWLTDAQAARLAQAARDVPAGGRIVEIGSFRGKSTIVLADAAADDVEVVAIDPHLGRDRAPRQTSESVDLGESDLQAFRANLEAAGVAERVRHLRLTSEDALGELPGEVAMLYVDGAHSYRFAHLDLTQWGSRVGPGAVMLIHDSFSSIGVTLALGRVTILGGGWEYLGRIGSLAAYRRASLSGRARALNVARQLAELPWFLRNVLVKALLVARLKPVARLLGHRTGPWPF